MKSFLKNVFLFCLIFFVVEKVFYVFLHISPSLEADQRLEKIIYGDLNKDLIIIGSSRGARNIIASQIEDSLNLASYNLSYPGSNIEFHEFMLSSLLKFNAPPEVVILAVDDPVELIPNEALGFRFDRLYPLAKYNYVNNELIKRGEKSILSKYLVLSRFNKANLNILQKSFNAVDSIQSNGSMPISFQRDNRNFIYKNDVSYNQEVESRNMVNAFIRLQNLCSKHSIKLLIVFSPNFKAHNKNFEKRIRELSHESVLFYTYNTNNLNYKKSNYYYDETHLQKNGAILFTNEIIGYLKENLAGVSK